MEEIELRVNVGGKELIFQTGKMAAQASGAVLMRYGDTVLLCTVTASREPRLDKGFFPLSVEFEEKMYAAGKIPGGFIKREGRPTEHATISARQVDRPIRPLFPKGFMNEIQIVCTTLSSDMENPIDILGICGASLALSISNIPFDGPIAGVRVGRVDGEFVINPTYQQVEAGDLSLVVAGGEDAIMMVEGSSKEVPEDVVLEALDAAHEAIRKIVESQKQMIEKCGKPKMEFEPVSYPEGLEEDVEKLAIDRVRDALDNKDKMERENLIADLKKEIREQLLEKEEYEGCERAIGEIIYDLQKKVFRENLSRTQIRPDGRKLDEVRKISCETGLLPRTHGSALFTRGMTQVLSAITLGTMTEWQRLDGITAAKGKKFMHQYCFPPYSVGETKPMRGPSRRDIGHGALAEHAVLQMMPTEDEFPYAVRAVSEVLESNGSSSMASVCATSLSLMDAGVPLRGTTAGIAMGLVLGDGAHYILTDIQGLEDGMGDMDFKVAGTRKGINALQMDIKVKGITKEIMKEALEAARKARQFVMDQMEKTISAPRKELSPYAPRIFQTKVAVDKIGEVIGPGGKNIRRMTEETGAKIDIMEDGRVFIYSTDKESGERALRMVEEITADLEVGKVYEGTVSRIMSFGAVVDLMPGKDGLVHISQIADHRIEKVEDHLKMGQKVKVRVRDIDDTGRVSLTMKDVR
ncbi:MAG: polyribonucleotide nucleotidyltransferase [bacterium]